MRRIVFAPGLAFLFLSLAIAPAIATPPPTFTLLGSFTGADGSDPNAPLIQGVDGFLYGANRDGGVNGDGDLYKIDMSGNNLADFLDFDGMSTPFGQTPLGNEIQGTDGNLYGTTLQGGANGEGTVYKVATDGTGYTDLYDFGGFIGDGKSPFAGLVQGSDGSFYGATDGGGAFGAGTIFKISSVGGSITILHSFNFTGDLLDADSSLIEGEDGSLYGTTESGGASGDGGIFRINLDGSGYTVLYSFAGTPDGSGGFCSLTQGGDGFLYGVTEFGGAIGDGTVFQIAPDGTNYQVLYSFLGGASDGGHPEGALALGNDGNLYGTLNDNGANEAGALFEIGRNVSTEDTILHNFDITDGASPVAGLLQATNGIFYGTATADGGTGNGTVFSLDNGLQASPTGLYALGSDAQVQLFWTTDTDAATYNVYRGTTSGGEGATPVATGLAVPQYFDNAVSNGTQYFYQVTAVDAGSNESAKSYEVTGTPQMNLAVSGLSVTGPVTASQSTSGTVTLIQGTSGPTTLFLSSSDPSVTFISPDVTVPTGQTSANFTVNTANTGSAVTATITASQNGQDESATLNVNAPSVLHTFQSGLQMISANTDDTGTTLANDFADPNADLAVWTGSTYAISPTAPANTIVPGQGYWFHPGSTTSLYDLGTDESDSATVNVALVQGWNMIGNPFDGSITGSDLEVQSGANAVSWATANTDGLIGDTLYTWQPSDTTSYESQPAASATLQAYEGYWLYAFKPCTLVLRDLP